MEGEERVLLLTKGDMEYLGERRHSSASHGVRAELARLLGEAEGILGGGDGGCEEADLEEDPESEEELDCFLRLEDGRVAGLGVAEHRREVGAHGRERGVEVVEAVAHRVEAAAGGGEESALLRPLLRPLYPSCPMRREEAIEE